MSTSEYTTERQRKAASGSARNRWPTSFFIRRDGLVKETHAGFAGPGNTVGHMALEHDVTALVEKLLAEPASTQTASAAR